MAKPDKKALENLYLEDEFQRANLDYNYYMSIMKLCKDELKKKDLSDEDKKNLKEKINFCTNSIEELKKSNWKFSKFFYEFYSYDIPRTKLENEKIPFDIKVISSKLLFVSKFYEASKIDAVYDKGLNSGSTYKCYLEIIQKIIKGPVENLSSSTKINVQELNSIVNDGIKSLVVNANKEFIEERMQEIFDVFKVIPKDLLKKELEVLKSKLVIFIPTGEKGNVKNSIVFSKGEIENLFADYQNDKCIEAFCSKELTPNTIDSIFETVIPFF